MLIIGRKLEEKLIIDEDIEITIIGVSGNRVRFGIKAPREIEIQRRYTPELKAADAAEPTGMESPEGGIVVAAGTSQSA